MYLSAIISRYLMDDGIGWMVFREIDGELKNPGSPAISYQQGNWLEERWYRKDAYKKEILTKPFLRNENISQVEADPLLQPQLYPTGFHVFKHEIDAESWVNSISTHTKVVVKRVRYRGVHTEGIVWNWVGGEDVPAFVRVAIQVYIPKNKEVLK